MSMVSVDAITPFHDHPFKLYKGDRLNDMVESIKEHGILTPYFHTVFTVPEELYPLIYSNQKLLYDALYHAAHQTMSELSADSKHLGATIG